MILATLNRRLKTMLGRLLQDTVTGFLLAGVGNVDLRKKTNFLIVNESTLVHNAHSLNLVLCDI
jgi:hypothetical protein